MDNKTMMMLGAVVIVGGAYLLYTKQSGPTPLSYLPQYGSQYPLIGGRPVQQSQTPAMIAAAASAAGRLLPGAVDFVRGLWSSSGGGVDYSSLMPAGSGVLLPEYQNPGYVFELPSFQQQEVPQYTQQDYYDTVLW